MGVELKFDASKLEEQVKSGCLRTEEIAEIVEEVATNYFNNVLKEIPIAKENSKSGWKYFKATSVRIYPDQSWVSIGFKGNEWEKYKHLFFQNYDVRSPHYGWMTTAINTNKALAKKELIALAKQKIGN